MMSTPLNENQREQNDGDGIVAQCTAFKINAPGRTDAENQF